MAKTATLLSLRDRVRRRVDLVNSNFVTDAELTEFINSSAAELYDVLIGHYGQDYYLSNDTISLVAGTDTYALPIDFYQLVGLDVLYSGDSISILPFQWHERNRYYNLDGSIPNLKYRIQGSNLKFMPMPKTAATVTVWYHPAITDLALDTDTFDGVNGWEEYIVIDASIKCRIKEEADTRELQSAKSEIMKRIENMASNRDSSEPMQFQTVERTTSIANHWPQG